MRQLHLRRQNRHAIGKLTRWFVEAGSWGFLGFHSRAGGASFRHVLYMTLPFHKVLARYNGELSRPFSRQFFRSSQTEKEGRRRPGPFKV